MSEPTISACGECFACETGDGWVECPNRDAGLHYVCACESSGCAESGGTMSDRDNDFRRLVPMLPGWTVSEPDGNLVKTLRAFRRADYASFPLPVVGAPLPEQFEFVGRIAKEVGAVGVETFWSSGTHLTTGAVRFAMPGNGWTTDQTKRIEDHCDDLAHAAIRAGIACRTVKS